MKKKLVALFLVVALLAIAVTGATLAYFTDTDSVKNVMTVGNVDIEQIEQQRNAATGALEPFVQNKPLFPAYFAGSSIPYADPAKYPVANDEAWKVCEDNANVVDKFVTVKNIGKSDAYVRTIVAYEGDETYGPLGAFIHVVHNKVGVTIEENIGVIDINGTKYTVMVYTYDAIVAPNETTNPSLKQIYMNKKADNDDVAVYGDTYDVLVLSQAVQAAGFTTATQALDEAFGDVTTTTAAEWLKDLA